MAEGLVAKLHRMSSETSHVDEKVVLELVADIAKPYEQKRIAAEAERDALRVRLGVMEAAWNRLLRGCVFGDVEAKYVAKVCREALAGTVPTADGLAERMQAVANEIRRYLTWSGTTAANKIEAAIRGEEPG